MIEASIILPTHNPDPIRLRRTLLGLKAQTVALDRWELLIVDNASSANSARHIDCSWHPNGRVEREEQLGLTAARLHGIERTRGAVLVFVDDDNVLAADYLETAIRLSRDDPALGAFGGQSRPEFETPPALWVREFHGLLALREHAPSQLRASWRHGAVRVYPECAPIGAGMTISRKAATAYAVVLATNPGRATFDRRGTDLVSGGDNDLVMSILESEMDVAYAPELRLLHLIPETRCTRQYLGRLNRAIARSWVAVLATHGIRPWSAIAPATVRLRAIRSWFRTCAWSNPAAWVRWQGTCGTFEGRAELRRARQNSRGST